MAQPSPTQRHASAAAARGVAQGRAGQAAWDGASPGQAQPLRRRFHGLGSACELVLHDAVASPAWQAEAEAAMEAAQAEVQRIEQAYSRYRPDSIVSRINQAAGTGQPIEVDEETAGLLDFAAQLHAASDGLFDITSGLLRRAWDFRTPRLPQADEVAALQRLIGWQQVHWQPQQRRIQLTMPGMELDFGGFGKEYAADRAAAVLAGLGLQHGYVNLGGDIRLLGPQADGQPWQFAIQHPRDPSRRVASIPLLGGALATSGDYERCFDLDGRRYCHVLDPRTGWPVAHWQSVSVLAPVCAAAGALCTITLLKQAEGLDWLRLAQLPFLLVGPDGQLTHEGGPLAAALSDAATGSAAVAPLDRRRP